MDASTIDLVEAGKLMARLIQEYGWERTAYAKRVGVSESAIRKYVSAEGTQPRADYIERIARGFGSRDGAKLLYAYGMDARAQQLAKADVEPIERDSVIELPEVETLTARLERHEELLEQILEHLRNQDGFAASLNDAKPGYRPPLTPVTDIRSERIRRRRPMRVSGWVEGPKPGEAQPLAPTGTDPS